MSVKVRSENSGLANIYPVEGIDLAIALKQFHS